MRWTFDTDAAAFAERVEPFLAGRPDGNLPATILMSILDGRYPADSAVLGAAVLTDLTNPTSNRIYADVGYRRAGDWEEIAFSPAG